MCIIVMMLSHTHLLCLFLPFLGLCGGRYDLVAQSCLFWGEQKSQRVTVVSGRGEGREREGGKERRGLQHLWGSGSEGGVR